MSYADLQAVQGRQSLVIPVTAYSVSVHIRTLYVALATVLGKDNPFAEAVKMLMEEWMEELNVVRFLDPVRNGPACCTMYLTLCCHEYFTTARTRSSLGMPGKPPVDDLMKLLRRYQFASVATQVPAEYWPEAAPKAATPAAAPKAAASGAPAAAAIAAGKQVQVVNKKPNATFRKYDGAGALKPGIDRAWANNETGIPKNAGGHQMCLAFHLRNSCSSNCSRAADHREHTAGEDAALAAWCKVAFPAVE